MPVTDSIVEVVAVSWELSTLVVPALFLVFFVVYVVKHRAWGLSIDVFISAQRDMTLTYGPVLVLGLALGGLVHVVTGMMQVRVAAIVLLALLYAYVRHDLPPVRTFNWQKKRNYVHLTWLAVPVASAAALATLHPLVQSVVALVFYSAIFWEL